MIGRPRHGAPRELLPPAAIAVVVLVTVSPWALGFNDSHAAVAEHIAFAMCIGPIAALVSALPAAAVSVTLAGAWLATSPWVLGYAWAGAGAWSADLLGGLALVVLSAAALRAAQPRQPYDAPAAMNGSRP